LENHWRFWRQHMRASTSPAYSSGIIIRLVSARKINQNTVDASA
jgi:hypothetical protein